MAGVSYFPLMYSGVSLFIFLMQYTIENINFPGDDKSMVIAGYLCILPRDDHRLIISMKINILYGILHRKDDQ